MANSDMMALVEEWGEDNVQAAFWLQKHIKDTGLDGIGYMEAGRNRIRSTGEFTVRQKLKSEMDSKY